MILIESKAESKSSSPINLSTPDEKSDSKSSLSFGELLRGVKAKVDNKEDSKIIQNGAKGAIVIAFDNKQPEVLEVKDIKTAGLLSLLKGDEAILGEELEPLELHPKLTTNMSVKELKTLISDAKNYLKEQILKSDGYKKAQVKDLPKTLKGLAQLAKKFDIDISKITLEQVRAKQTPETPLVKTEVKSEVKADDNSKTKRNTKTKEVDDTPDLKLEVKSNKKTAKNTKTAIVDNDSKVDVKQDIKQEVKNDIKVENTKVNALSAKDLQTPIFKAQASVEKASTEQVVFAKQFKPAPAKTAKDRADETLKLLLRGEKPSHINANITADFSVATAKVIAPSATTDAARSLEALLRGDSSTSGAELKTEQMTVHKADSFEVKLNEAKQMVKYLSSDIKQAIEDYKSPFTRVKVQLNPQKLGEVDLTVIQRGKNLHVNIGSNNMAVNALAANLNELRTQLNNNGINNATFNFNSGSENGGSANEQRNNRQQEQKNANEEYNYYNKQEDEEILSSLEIIVPSYV